MIEESHLPRAAHRWAIYFSPPADSPWAREGARWLGRDVDGGGIAPPRPAPGWSADAWGALTEEPRRYGWHATLRAPWRLADRYSPVDLLAALRGIADGVTAFELPTLRARRLGGFIALRPLHPCAQLDALARSCVTALQPLAAPLLPAELARYAHRNLTPRQRDQLGLWGYPYVFEDFHFHMTLTGRLDALAPSAQEALLQEAAARFDMLAQPLALDALSLFVEPAPGAPMRRIARVPLAAPGEAPT